MQELIQLLNESDNRIDLDRAALTLARIEFPDLEIEPFLHLLDSYAVELADRLAGSTDGAEYVDTANAYLFEELGFVGNGEDYYNPLNSCLNEVLTSRVGIPITLSIVYMEIGRRLAKPIHGIGLPGHFIVRYDDGEYSTFLDPFHGGARLEAGECFRLAKEVSGIDVSEDPALLAPVGKRQMLLRMVNNLRGIYLTRRAYPKALSVLDLLLVANPDSADDYRQRAVVLFQMQRMGAAKADLERYLRLAPEAADRADVEKQVAAIRLWVAGMN